MVCVLSIFLLVILSIVHYLHQVMKLSPISVIFIGTTVPIIFNTVQLLTCRCDSFFFIRIMSNLGAIDCANASLRSDFTSNLFRSLFFNNSKVENPNSHKYVVGNGSKIFITSNARFLNFGSLAIFNQNSKYFDDSKSALRVKSFFKSMTSSCNESGRHSILDVKGDTIQS